MWILPVQIHVERSVAPTAIYYKSVLSRMFGDGSQDMQPVFVEPVLPLSLRFLHERTQYADAWNENKEKEEPEEKNGPA